MRLTLHCSILLLLILGCTTAPSPPGSSEENPMTAPPVDRAIAAQVVAAWTVRESVDADLDGDGERERVVLAADVTTSPSGALLWEDGHRWAAFVEEPDGVRTMLYSAFVPNGHSEMAIGIASSDRRRDVFILERTPQQVRTLVVAYEGAGRARGVSAGHYHLERWVKDLRTK